MAWDNWIASKSRHHRAPDLWVCEGSVRSFKGHFAWDLWNAHFFDHVSSRCGFERNRRGGARSAGLAQSSGPTCCEQSAFRCYLAAPFLLARWNRCRPNHGCSFHCSNPVRTSSRPCRFRDDHERWLCRLGDWIGIIRRPHRLEHPCAVPLDHHYSIGGRGFGNVSKGG